MADPNLYNQFVQTARGNRLGAQLGQGITEIQQVNTARKNNEAYQQALSTYMGDQSPENLMMLNEAASRIGRFDELQTQLGAYDEAQARQVVDQLGSQIYAPALAGNTDLALSNIDAQLQARGINPDALNTARMAESTYKQAMERATTLPPQSTEAIQARFEAQAAKQRYEAAIQQAQAQGADDDALQLLEMRDALKEGRINEVTGLLGIELGQTQTGRDFVENIRAQNEDRRNALMTDAQLIQIGQNLEYLSPEERQRVSEIASELPSGMGREIAEMGKVIGNIHDGRGGRLTQDDLLDREESLRKEYDNYVEPYVTMGQAAETIRRIVETGNASGFSDTSLTILFSKILDPDSVVRESEAARIEAAQGVLQQFGVTPQRIAQGVQFSDEARNAIKDVLDDLVSGADATEQMQRERLTNTLDYIWGDREEEKQASINRVFPLEEQVPISRRTEPSVQLARDLIRTANPQSGFQNGKTIEQMSLEELQENYPLDWNRYFGETWRIPTGSGNNNNETRRQPSLWD